MKDLAKEEKEWSIRLNTHQKITQEWREKDRNWCQQGVKDKQPLMSKAAGPKTQLIPLHILVSSSEMLFGHHITTFYLLSLWKKQACCVVLLKYRKTSDQKIITNTNVWSLLFTCFLNILNALLTSSPYQLMGFS